MNRVEKQKLNHVSVFSFQRDSLERHLIILAGLTFTLQQDVPESFYILIDRSTEVFKENM